MVGKWFGFEREEVFEEALSAFERGDYDEASKALEACLAEDPSDPRVKQYLGKCYEAMAEGALQDENYDLAAAMAENATVLHPGFPDLHLLAAKAFRGLRRTAIARYHLNRALELHPNFAEALAFDVEAGPESVHSGTKPPFRGASTGKDPEFLVRGHVEELRNLGDECLRANLLPEAVAAYKKAIELMPGYPDLHCHLASAYIYLGEFGLAENHLALCLQINGHYVDALVRMSHVHLLKGNPIASAEVYRQAEALDPTRASQYAMG